MEKLHSTEDFQENLLHGIRSVRRVGQNPVDEAVNRLMELPNKPGVGLFGPGFQFRNDGGFFRPNADRTCEIAHVGCSRHERSVALPPIIGPRHSLYTSVRPRGAAASSRTMYAA